MTKDRIAELRAREAAATPGPWEGYWGRGERPAIIGPGMCVIAQQVRPADAEFIALVRTAVPRLLAAHDALVAENARLQTLLHGGLRPPTDADPPGTLLGYVAFVKGEHQTPLPYRGDDDDWE